MLPVLQIGPLSLQTYPLALLLAAWAALAVGARVARRCGLDGEHIVNAGLYGLAAGLAAARLGHVIVYWQAYRTQLLEVFGLNTRAFLLWPGLVAGLVVAGWYVCRRRLPLAQLMDSVAPALLIGAAVASLGALLAGRALGAASSVPWAVEVWGIRRHPSQGYEALAALILAGIVLWMIRKGSRPGMAAWSALAGAGLSRWLLEPFRAESAVTPGGLRVAQIVGLAVALLALWVLGARYRPRP